MVLAKALEFDLWELNLWHQPEGKKAYTREDFMAPELFAKNKDGKD